MDIDPGEENPLDNGPPPFRILTRSATSRQPEESNHVPDPLDSETDSETNSDDSMTDSNREPEPDEPAPVSYGGCFVDCNLLVVVRPALATMMEFDPTDIHGTTRLWNRITRACAFTASTWIWKAFEEASKGPGVERAQEGTGAETE